MGVTVEYGQCGLCGSSNPKVINVCRQCNGMLPWSKGAKAASKAAANSDKMTLGDVAWAAMGVQIFGGFLFVAGIGLRLAMIVHWMPRIPFAGYIVMLIGIAVWKAGASMD